MLPPSSHKRPPAERDKTGGRALRPSAPTGKSAIRPRLRGRSTKLTNRGDDRAVAEHLVKPARAALQRRNHLISPLSAQTSNLSTNPIVASPRSANHTVTHECFPLRFVSPFSRQASQSNFRMSHRSHGGLARPPTPCPQALSKAASPGRSTSPSKPRSPSPQLASLDRRRWRTSGGNACEACST
jgi:hypothetical protein